MSAKFAGTIDQRIAASLDAAKAEYDEAAGIWKASYARVVAARRALVQARADARQAANNALLERRMAEMPGTVPIILRRCYAEVFRTNVHRDFTVWSEGYAGASVDEIITNHGLSRSLINAILLRGDRAV
ncbi:MAG TPA: hypothetical protein VGC15_20355, partial [Acetobacteraceae bacterium]